MKHSPHPAILFTTASLVLVFLLALNIFCGSVHLPFVKIVSALTGAETDPVTRYIIIESRLPQALTALLCGATLAASGLVLQTLFQNPLADPSILGVNSGASLGVAIVMLLLGGSVVTMGAVLSGFLLIVAAAFAGALSIIALLALLANYVRSNITLLIIGIMISYITSSVISLLNYSATEQGVHSYVMWGLGNFGGVSLKAMPFFSIAMTICTVFCITLIKPLNALLLGNRYACNLGFNIKRIRNAMLISTGLISALTTAFCGPISFIGLAVPHITRMVSRTANNRTLMPLALLFGGIIGLTCNWVCSLPSDGTLIPLNVVTPLFGVPVILYVLVTRR